MNIRFTESDWQRIETEWTRFWQGKQNRPMICMEMADPASQPVPGFFRYFQQYSKALSGDDIMKIETRNLERIHWLGDAYPKRFLNFGPGSMASYMGSPIGIEPDTIWFYALGKSIREIEIKVDRQSEWFKRVQEIQQAALKAWGNAVQLSVSDIGGNLDTLASLRGTEDLLMDMLDDTDTVARLTRDITREWIKVYLDEVAALRKVCRGITPWSPQWSKENGYMFQCDLSYMFGNDLFEQMVVPDLEECCKHIPCSFYHLDGKGALKHLDSLLNIKSLKGVQWIPGAGQPEASEWPEVLTRIRKAGKFCEIHVTLEAALKLKKSMDLSGFIIGVIMPKGISLSDAKKAADELMK